jgi:hypothetical protein
MVTKEMLAVMTDDEITNFICGTYEWSDPNSPNYPEEMALVDCELLRRVRQGGSGFDVNGIIEGWKGMNMPTDLKTELRKTQTFKQAH